MPSTTLPRGPMLSVRMHSPAGNAQRAGMRPPDWEHRSSPASRLLSGRPAQPSPALSSELVMDTIVSIKSFHIARIAVLLFLVRDLASIGCTFLGSFKALD